MFVDETICAATFKPACEKRPVDFHSSTVARHCSLKFNVFWGTCVWSAIAEKPLRIYILLMFAIAPHCIRQLRTRKSGNQQFSVYKPKQLMTITSRCSFILKKNVRILLRTPDSCISATMQSLFPLTLSQLYVTWVSRVVCCISRHRTFLQRNRRHSIVGSKIPGVNVVSSDFALLLVSC